MNNMNKYLNYLVAYLLSLAALSSCSDDNEPKIGRASCRERV